MMTDVTDHRDLGAIIPSILDDFGLTPAQFRIYGRIARRVGRGGKCNESAINMAKACHMNVKTVREAVHFLESHCLIKVERRGGKPSDIILTHSKCWIKPSPQTGIPKIDPTQNEPSTLPKMSLGGEPKTGRHPTQNEPTKDLRKGIPLKNPIKGENPDAHEKKLFLKSELPPEPESVFTSIKESDDFYLYAFQELSKDSKKDRVAIEDDAKWMVLRLQRGKSDPRDRQYLNQFREGLESLSKEDESKAMSSLVYDAIMRKYAQ